MKRLRTLEREADQRLQLARQLLQQRSAMLRMSLTPVEWLCFKMGCSILQAEKLVEAVKEEKAQA